MDRLLPITITLNEQTRGGNIKKVRHNVKPLNETSLNQMMEHGKTGMAVISSQVERIDRDDPELSLRDKFDKFVKKVYGGMETIDSDALYDIEKEWLKRRNAAADKQLKKDIMSAGWSFTPVFGGYRMQDTGNETHEPSYVVYCYKKGGKLGDFEDLKRFAINMCRKYSQESVYVQAPGEPPVYLDRHGNQINTSSSLNFKFNRESEPYFTTIRRDKDKGAGVENLTQRFHGDIVFNEMYVPLKPGDLNERMRRDKQGEYIL